MMPVCVLHQVGMTGLQSRVLLTECFWVRLPNPVVFEGATALYCCCDEGATALYCVVLFLRVRLP